MAPLCFGYSATTLLLHANSYRVARVTESAKSKRELPSEDYGNHSGPRVLACSSQHRRPYMLVCPAQSLSRTGVISIPRRLIPHRDRASTKVPMSADPKRVLGETRASDRITRTNAWNVGPNSPTQLDRAGPVSDQSTPYSEVAPSILAPRFQTLLAHACIRLQPTDPHCPRTRLRMDVAVSLLDQEEGRDSDMLRAAPYRHKRARSPVSPVSDLPVRQ